MPKWAFFSSLLGVYVYLKSLGLFKVLTDNGVEVDDRGIPERRDPQLVLRLVNFRSENDVARLANEALDAVNRSGLSAGNLRMSARHGNCRCRHRTYLCFAEAADGSNAGPGTARRIPTGRCACV